MNNRPYPTRGYGLCTICGISIPRRRKSGLCDSCRRIIADEARAGASASKPDEEFIRSLGETPKAEMALRQRNWLTALEEA